MSPPPWAYQVENFNPAPDEELVCSICQAVFCDPVQSPCHHVFCRNCIVKWLESNRNCPICRKRTTRSTLQEVVPIIKNMIMKLTLYCHNSSRGCEEKFTLESCEAHVKECAYELVQCKNKPCKLKFIKKDLADHELNSCPHSFIRCATCKLKMPSHNPKTHNCIEELQKKLREKTEKLKKTNQKLKKLKEKFKRLRDDDLFSSVSSSTESLSEVMFSFTENSNLSASSRSSSSLLTDSADEDDNMWSFSSPLIDLQEELNFQLSQMNNYPNIPSTDDSVEYPRASSPLSVDDSVLVDSSNQSIEPTYRSSEGIFDLHSPAYEPSSSNYEPIEPIRIEPIQPEPIQPDPISPYFEAAEPVPAVRRPPKRRLKSRFQDSSDEDTGLQSPLPSRKRAWPVPTAGVSSLDTAGPSYLSSTSTADSSTSTNDSSSSRNRNKFKLKPKLRSRSIEQPAARSVVSESSSATLHPIFERTINLLERYNLESDPEWLPDTSVGDSSDGLNISDNDLYVLPGHITSSDESSISDLNSDSSYEDAAEGRTEDLLNNFYGSSDSDSDEWQPQ